MRDSGSFSQFLMLTRWRLGDGLGRVRKLFKNYQDALTEPTERARMDELFKLVQPYTMIYYEELFNLYKLACAVQEGGVSGALVECGVCNGGSAAVLASVFAASPQRMLWLYDNFAGLPPAGPKDGDVAP